MKNSWRHYIRNHLAFKYLRQCSNSNLFHTKSLFTSVNSKSQSISSHQKVAIHLRTWRNWIFLTGGGFILYRGYRNYRQSILEESVYDIPAWKVALFRGLPLNSMTRIIGWLANLPVPVFMRSILYGAFTRLYGCNLEECATPLSSYPTFNEFFARELRPGIRPINPRSIIVSPVDGQVLATGKIISETGIEDIKKLFPEQVKGVRYPLGKLLGTSQKLKPNTPLYYCSVYLAPGSYHRFHCPVDGLRVDNIEMILGDTLPVAPWLLKWFPGLVSLNQRAVIQGKWSHGNFWMIPVGATNVKSINLNIKTGQCLKKGDQMGKFEMGSLVLMIFEGPSSFNWQDFSSENGIVRLGQAMNISSNKKRFLFF